MPNIQIDIITDFSELERHASDWARLWQGDPRATIFGSFDWALAAWRAYGARRTLCAPIARQSDRVVAILPFVVENGTLRFLAEPRSDYNDILCESDVGSEVIQAALTALRDAPVAWRRCVFENVPEDSHLLTHLPALASRTGLLVHRSEGTACSCVDLRSDADQILGEILKKKSLKRHEKDLARLGSLSFRHLEDREEAKAHLPEFFRQHIARRALAGEKSLFCDAAARTFYEALVDQCDPSRELRISVVELDGRPVAYHFGFECNGVLVWYKPTFDVDYWDYSPGEVLIKKLFEYVKEKRLQKLDFTVGDEAFKDRFSNCVTTNFTVRIFRRGPYGAVQSVALKTKASAKKHPAIYGAVKKAFSQTRCLYDEFQSAVRRHGILRFGQKLATSTCRNLIFSRDAVLVFASEGAGMDLAENGLELKPGTLGELARLAETHGDFLDTRKLSQARQRLRRGDKLLIARKNGKFAHVAWVGLRPEIAAGSEVGDQCRIPLKTPSAVIYDCWTAPSMRGQGIYPSALRAIVAQNQPETPQHWIYCHLRNVASMRGIEKAGFQLRYRMERIRLLRCLTLNRVRNSSGSKVDHVSPD